MFCYRRHGHNEGDDPSFTQPLMYRKIKDRPTIAEVYTEQLVLRGDLTAEEAEAIDHAFQGKLHAAQQEVKTGPPRRGGMRGFTGAWQSIAATYSHVPVKTGVEYQTLRAITDTLTNMPEKFTVNPKIGRL